MTIALDKAVQIGEIVVAAIVHHSVRCQHSSTVSFQANKYPVAILVRRDNVTATLDIDGSRITPADVEERFPGQRAAFERAVSALF